MIKKRFKRVSLAVLLSVILLLLLVVISEYKFKNDIIIGMKPKEIEDIYGKPDLVSRDSTDLVYTYRNFWNKTVFVFHKKDDKLKTKWRENWYFIYGNEVNN